MTAKPRSSALLPLLVALASVLLLVPVALPPAAVAGPDTPAGPDEETRADVKRMVEELREEASRIRGLPWRFEVPADFLSRDQLRANLVKMVEEEVEPEELERDTRIARRIGMLAPDEDPLELMLGMLGEMIGGYYNPETKHLYLIEGMTGDAQKPVILHELIHALEDQYVDLDERTERWKNDPDRLFAEQCIVEGSAEHARILYQKEHPEIARAYLEGQQDPEAMRRQMEVIQKVPAWMMVSTLLHYDVGPRLVTRYVGEDYAGGMARLYAYGPVTQEQFLHPERFLGARQDYPHRIELPKDLAAKAGEGWKELHAFTTGELDLAMYLDFFLGMTQGKLNLMLMMQGKYYVSRAAQAAEGWDGGRTVFLEKEGAPLAWVQVHAFDTAADAHEAYEAIRDALAKANAGAWALRGETESNEGPVEVRTADYAGRHGQGRLQQRGSFLYLLDGVDAATMEALWPAVLETRIEKDPRDTWDAANIEDPFEGLALVNRDAGVGLDLPQGWTAGDARAQPMAALAFAKEGVDGTVTAMPGGAGVDVVSVIEDQLARTIPGFDPADREAAKVGGVAGHRYDLGRMRIYLVALADRTLMVRFHGAPAALEQLTSELDAIAAGIRVAP